MSVLIAALGFALLLEGAPLLLFPRRWRGWVRLLSRMPPGRLRFVGLMMSVAGALVAAFALGR